MPTKAKQIFNMQIWLTTVIYLPTERALPLATAWFVRLLYILTFLHQLEYIIFRIAVTSTVTCLSSYPTLMYSSLYHPSLYFINQFINLVSSLSHRTTLKFNVVPCICLQSMWMWEWLLFVQCITFIMIISPKWVM